MRITVHLLGDDNGAVVLEHNVFILRKYVLMG